MRKMGQRNSSESGSISSYGIGRQGEWRNSIFPVITYLSAAVLANFLVTVFGPKALPFTAFILIPFDMTARDVLHEQWKFKNLWLKMSALVFAGSTISWLSSTGSATVCMASSVSFCASGFTDSIVYHLMNKCHQNTKMKLSNAVSAFTDSVFFPLIAFGEITLWVFLAQWWLKAFGGFLWVEIYSRWRFSRVDPQ